MSLAPDPLDELVIPDETAVEEHDLVADSDIIVGGQSTIEFGVRGRNVMAGERVEFGGGIEADGDCRLDMWCDVAEDVLVGKDAYLGERVHVGGQLMVSGDLDIGDDVNIEEGFEANGWIVIRNPMPTIVLLMVYLSHMLRIGEDDAAEELVSDMLKNVDDETDEDPLIVPRGGQVSDDAWQVSTPARIGTDCRINGNIRASTITIDAGNNVFGSLRARGDITVGKDTKIHGDVTTRGGDVVLDEGVRVLGDVSGNDVTLEAGAGVEGVIRARGEMRVEPGNGRDPE
ncbi:MAG: acyltransferase [Halobacteriales archaeon]